MVTMQDIAEHAGVSRTTVSFVLNKPKTTTARISEETRRRVLSSASLLKYQTNELAKSVVTGKNRVLGVLTSPDMHNALQIMTGANEAAEEQDYLLKVLHLSYSTVDENVVARCQKWRLAGVMVFGLSDEVHERLHDAFERVGMPLALVDNAPRPSRWAIWGTSDEAQGMRLAVSHLAELGHRRIAFIGGDAGSLSDWREQSFRETMAEHCLTVPDQWIRQSSWQASPSAMEEAAASLLAIPLNRPTAIICASDPIAMMTQRVARSLGLRIPTDLSIMGYGDRECAIFADPPLTTVRQSFHELGRIAAHKLIGLAENKEVRGDSGQVREFVVPASLVTRGSTAPPLTTNTFVTV